LKQRELKDCTWSTSEIKESFLGAVLQQGYAGMVARDRKLIDRDVRKITGFMYSGYLCKAFAQQILIN